MVVCHLSTVHSRYDNRILNKQCVSLSKFFTTYLVIADGLSDEVYNGVYIKDIGKPKNKFFRMFFSVFYAFIMAKKLKADVYQIHDPELLPLGFIFSLLGMNIVYDIHEDYITSIKNKQYIPFLLRLPLASLVGYIELFFSKFMFCLIAEKYYAKRFPSALTILNYPIINELSSLNSFDSDSSLLLYTGNITIDRGALKTLEVSDYLPNFTFKMVGKCNLDFYNKYSFDNSNNINVIGVDRYVPFDEIIQCYDEGALAGIALFPYSHHYAEKELTKFFEYMAVGLPIIASNFSVWKSLIEDNGVGLCVDIDDTNEIISAINWLKDNPCEAYKMGQKGKSLVMSNFNWDIEFNKLLNFYNESF